VLSVTFADLRYRYRQFLIAVIGAGAVLGMAVLMSGLVTGFRSEINDTIKAVGADRWLMPAQAGARVTSVITFDEAAVQQLAATPGVTSANGIAFLPSEVIHSGSKDVTANIMGVGSGALGQPDPQRGHGLTGAGQMVVGTRADIPLGSTVLFGTTPFHVVGTIADRSLGAGIPMVYVQLADAQRAFGGQKVVTAVVTTGIPAHIPADLVALTPDQVTDSTLQTLAGGIKSIKTSRILMWIVAVLIVAALIYVSALQRVRDFAVLKALGSSSALLFASLCLQAVVVTLFAAAVGVVLSTVMTGLFQQTVDVPASAYYTLPIIAVGVGLIASLSALRRATGADPVAAFG
jgi:putative ABC transport system permease protein